MTTTQDHMKISDDFQARVSYEFDRGDLLQASEKAWGAVAHCIKAISEERGWDHGGHRKLIDNAHALINESDHPERYVPFIYTVNALHQNFYENVLSRDLVRRGIDEAFLLIDFLKTRSQNGAA